MVHDLGQQRHLEKLHFWLLPAPKLLFLNALPDVLAHLCRYFLSNDLNSGLRLNGLEQAHRLF